MLASISYYYHQTKFRGFIRDRTKLKGGLSDFAENLRGLIKGGLNREREVVPAIFHKFL